MTTIKNIKQSIQNYVKSTSEYALLIDGEWGTGKTYFVNKNFFPEIQVNDKTYTSIYMSVYGCDSLIEVKKKINVSILKNKGFRKMFSDFDKDLDGVGTIQKTMEQVPVLKDNSIFKGIMKGVRIGIDEIVPYIDEVQLKNQKEKIILFIDDLERLSDEIEMKDFLGLIHSDYIEQLGFKVIFISDTTKLEGKHRCFFDKTKEKIIDKTILFEYDNEVIVKEIVGNSSNIFLKENIEWISDMLELCNKTINIRTLKSISNNFIYLDGLLKEKVENQHSQKFEKSLFLNTMVLTNEFKLGKINGKVIRELKFNEKSLKLLNTLNYMELLGVVETDKEKIQTEITDEEVEVRKIVNTINKQYHGLKKEFDEYIFYFADIQNYIIHGYFDIEQFKESYEKWKSFFYPTKELNNINMLHNFREMTDIDLEERQAAILESLKENKYNFQELLEIYNWFIVFNKFDLILVNKKFDKIEKSIVNSIQESYPNTDREDLTRLEVIADSLEEDNKIKELKNKLKDLDEERLKKEYSKVLNNLFENKVFETTSKNGNEIVFDLLNESNLLEEYVLCNNGKSEQLRYYLHSQYFTKEKIKSSNVKGIIKKLERTNELGRIDNFNIKKLIEEFKIWE